MTASGRSSPLFQRTHACSASTKMRTSGKARSAASPATCSSGTRAQQTSAKAAYISTDPLQAFPRTLQKKSPALGVGQPGRLICDLGEILFQPAQRNQCQALVAELLLHGLEAAGELLAVGLTLSGGKRVRIGLVLRLFEHAVDQRGQRLDLLLTVPDIAQHPQVRLVGRLPSAQESRRRRQF